MKFVFTRYFVRVSAGRLNPYKRGISSNKAKFLYVSSKEVGYAPSLVRIRITGRDKN